MNRFILEHFCVRGRKVVVFLDPQGQELLDQCRQDETRWTYFDMFLLMHWTTKTYQQIVFPIKGIGIKQACTQSFDGRSLPDGNGT